MRPVLVSAERQKDKLAVDGVLDMTLIYQTDDSDVPVSVRQEDAFHTVFATEALPGDDLPLDETGRAILSSLLRGEDPAALVKGTGKPPSVVADELNEALFDELGDSAVDGDGQRLTLIEEYREELLSLFGG